MTALRERHHYLCSSPGYRTAAELCFLVAHMLLGCGKCQEGPFHFTPKSEYAQPHHERQHQLDCHASPQVKRPAGPVTL